MLTTKPRYERAAQAVELVAATTNHVVGIIDVVVATERPELATIETIAVHPDAGRQGIGTALLGAAIRRLPPGVTTVDAWTRDDEAANAWYRRNGFGESFRYLHVYAGGDGEIERAITAPAPPLTPVWGFFHAAIEREAELRESYRRVHVCRRYERPAHP